MTRVIALNCSPRMEKGNTAQVFDPFVTGMRGAGADVELVHTKRLKIQPCIGDFQCWYKTPGICRFDDDVPALLERMARADIWAFGVPVYAKLPGELQNLLNRTMPLFDPKVVIRGGALLPSRRDGLELKTIALVSSCAYWGLENFELLIANFEFLAKAFDVKLARSLLRPNSDLFAKMARDGDDSLGILAASERAGAQLVKRGSIRKEAAEAVQVPLMTLKEFMANAG